MEQKCSGENWGGEGGGRGGGGGGTDYSPGGHRQQVRRRALAAARTPRPLPTTPARFRIIIFLRKYTFIFTKKGWQFKI